ncbi:tRNA (guanine(46)-N(7))-methyltransferase TrmB [Aliidiomarina maris]|uniref:tRNA (guanine(46)-N(7))-methyltransferase n=1 Tax=Aliidiomarina maris TaxID=531312 RepID=A0A327WU49_9GAMM|nr:methyltransferase domain-containing protein [Aliidiomarina maris]RAJ94979.1 tRNA G46 methylase TrmB [Aliidiomarina maris]RUO22185.1 SAM-dependent methyltransferase [Aliidiomarina maris]
MEYQSRGIDSNQHDVHQDIAKVVRRHLNSEFLKPIASHSHDVFAAVDARVQAWQGPIVLDSCCGVGESTLQLAQRHPDALVIGVDKSAHRLAKTASYGEVSARCVLVRADLNDFWRQALTAKWQISHHYILYPNPWPKAKHLQRRWHGGPLFPAIIALGGQLELRSNWRIYLAEFAAALEIAGYASELNKLPAEIAPITPFERKYQATEQVLWQLQSNLC